jgi:hypothetical protein
MEGEKNGEQMQRERDREAQEEKDTSTDTDGTYIDEGAHTLSERVADRT